MTKEELKQMELNTPTYKFVDLDEGEEPLSLIKQPIAKIQETATTFSLYDVYKVLGQYDRQIDEAEKALEKMRNEKALFEAELAMVEKSLQVKDGVKLFSVETAVEEAVNNVQKS